MRVSLMLAAAAISLSGAAFAEEAATGPQAATGPAAMSDAEMDRVTAAGGPPAKPGVGTGTAGQVSGQATKIFQPLDNGVTPGGGTNTGQNSSP